MGTTELEQIVRDEISREGAISVARFMQLALYHPGLGYYRRASDPFGRKGDFYTAEQLQPVFGELMATYAARTAESFRGEERFEILELGAGRGELAGALSRWPYSSFDWSCDSLPETFSGLVIANEFFDALPVHVLRKRAEGWSEVVVTWRGGSLVFAESREMESALQTYAERYGDALPLGGLLEVNRGIRNWLERVAGFLRRGTMLAIDYGYAARELLRFPLGTLMSYRRHVADANVLAKPGTRDITAHVNFSYLREEALRSGFEFVSEESLASWTLSVWNEDELRKKWEAGDQRWRLQWKNLAIGMGETFRVLTLKAPQNKNAPENSGAEV